jgi:hypothetical protein
LQQIWCAKHATFEILAKNDRSKHRNKLFWRTNMWGEFKICIHAIKLGPRVSLQLNGDLSQYFAESIMLIYRTV